MNAEVFVDTNVLLYTIDEEPANAAKRERAQELLLSERWSWSVQVAAEFFVNATSPKRPFRLPAADAATLVEAPAVPAPEAPPKRRRRCGRILSARAAGAAAHADGIARARCWITLGAPRFLYDPPASARKGSSARKGRSPFGSRNT